MFIVYVQVNCKVWVHTETSTITDINSPTALLCEACQYLITQCSNYNVKIFRSRGIMFIVYVQANCKVWVHTETSIKTDIKFPHSTTVWSLPIFYNTVLQLQCKDV